MVPSMDFSTPRTHGSWMCCFSVSPKNLFHLTRDLINDIDSKGVGLGRVIKLPPAVQFHPSIKNDLMENVCRVKSRSIAGVSLFGGLIEIDDAHRMPSQYKSPSVCKRWVTYRIKSCQDTITVNHSSLGEKDCSFSLIWVLLNNLEENAISFSQLISFNGVLIFSWSMNFVLDVSPKNCPWGKSTFEANGPKLIFVWV